MSGHNVANDETFTITLTSKQGRAIFLVFALLLGGGSVGNIFMDKRPDPFTGAQGEALNDRITYLELVTENIIEADAECKKRLDNHLEYSANKVRELDVTLERHKIKLEECLHRTGVK